MGIITYLGQNKDKKYQLNKITVVNRFNVSKYCFFPGLVGCQYLLNLQDC
jgi:hypothetical protein